MRVLWMNDLHLNFDTGREVYAFLAAVADHAPDAVLVGRDTGQASDLALYREEMAEVLRCPIYFVLGNHDFYGSSIAAARRQASTIARANHRLCWLTQAGVVKLTTSTCLLGHDGWADGRCGDYASSEVLLNDYALIEELANLDKPERLKVLYRLGDEAADHFRSVLPAAIERHQQVVLLTHVPPLREACWHEGRISDADWLPHMACKAVGDMLLDIMKEHPDRRLTVLSGHTHSSGEARPLSNLHLLTGAATYGAPAVTRVFEVI